MQVLVFLIIVVVLVSIGFIPNKYYSYLLIGLLLVCFFVFFYALWLLAGVMVN